MMPVDSPNQNDVAFPNPPSGRREYRKLYKEQKDKPLVHQDTFSTWCRALPKLRRDKDKKKDQGMSSQPEEKVDKIQSFFADVLKRKQGATDVTKSPEHRELENDDTEDASFSRHPAEGCWCLQNYISDVKALDMPYESSNIL
ncbi:hypothetical protein IRJ41_011842 [Triplophysa rosa]|uniref:Uncharacterized protein n=1 Tax=Triplophysa rosa TaxID=992332 RepID=A0A9W7TL24_TRIRA|nr:hypothetical protein IRJ41_011842 [Triplophysa rosa]